MEKELDCALRTFTDSTKCLVIKGEIDTNGVVMGCVYIEVKAILENLIIINTKDDVMNDIARYLLVPIHSALLLKLPSIKVKE